MKLVIVALCATCAFADVSHIVNGDKDAQIVRQGLDVNPDGQYSWEVETSNGINARAAGQLINANTDNAAIVVEGASSYKSPEGELVEISYIADENGYQPQGSHIPTPPPIPDAILRALQYIAANPPKPETN